MFTLHADVRECSMGIMDPNMLQENIIYTIILLLPVWLRLTMHLIAMASIGIRRFLKCLSMFLSWKWDSLSHATFYYSSMAHFRYFLAFWRCCWLWRTVSATACFGRRLLSLICNSALCTELKITVCIIPDVAAADDFGYCSSLTSNNDYGK